ncbi:uncharacterized protein TNCV_1018021 [Trichonephila clavipes]|uniref:Uncharacterized protein n=1 Tax=Trichonephila clavipes TaxID=2585209 RepID=A0A8X6VYK4_TRICX|nr:uncharacterized protein TNCV_1018021 [Trichonephila clavipes]
MNKNISPIPSIEKKIVRSVLVAQWIARWTSNLMIVGRTKRSSLGLGSGECGQHPCPLENRREDRKGPGIIGQPIGVTVHFTQQPIREQPLSSQSKQKLFKTYKAQKPRLPDPIIQPIAVMPPSRTKNPTFTMPLIEDSSRNGIEDCSYSPEAQKKQRLFKYCQGPFIAFQSLWNNFMDSSAQKRSYFG